MHLHRNLNPFFKFKKSHFNRRQTKHHFLTDTHNKFASCLKVVASYNIYMYRYTPTYIRYTHYTGQTFSAELRKLQVISLLHLLNIYTEKRQLHDNYLF